MFLVSHRQVDWGAAEVAREGNVKRKLIVFVFYRMEGISDAIKRGKLVLH